VRFILSVIKKLDTSCRRHEACLLNFLLLDFHLSGGAARPSSAVKNITVVRRTTHAWFRSTGSTLTSLAAWPPVPGAGKGWFRYLAERKNCRIDFAGTSSGI
jgi:hypothetical protein